MDQSATLINSIPLLVLASFLGWSGSLFSTFAPPDFFSYYSPRDQVKWGRLFNNQVRRTWSSVFLWIWAVQNHLRQFSVLDMFKGNVLGLKAIILFISVYRENHWNSLYKCTMCLSLLYYQLENVSLESYVEFVESDLGGPRELQVQPTIDMIV